MYGAEFGFVPAMQLLCAIRNRPFSRDISPNPIDKDEALQLIKTIQLQLPSIPGWLRDNQKQVVSIGDIKSIFSLAQVATGLSTFTKEAVMQAILAHIGKQDI